MKYRNVIDHFTLVYNNIYPQTILAQFLTVDFFESHTIIMNIYTQIDINLSIGLYQLVHKMCLCQVEKVRSSCNKLFFYIYRGAIMSLLKKK